jgi:hypothetical protein
MPAYSTSAKRISHSYFVVMIDYGPNYPGKKGPSGLEAVVQPEQTRYGIVAQLASGESKHVAFIHWISDGLVEDVTDELFDLAEQVARRPLQAAE